MPNANTKKVILMLMSLTLIVISGYSNPATLRAHHLKKVEQLRAAGDHTSALTALDTLSRTYPNDTEILWQIGDIHQTLGNHTEAAFYLSVACSLAPDNVELLYQTYHAQESAHQHAAAYELLEALVAIEPNGLTDTLWQRLGWFRAQAQQTSAALNAYLNGVDPETSTPATETAVAIGTLFKQLNNLPQAERWLTIAAENNDDDALTALFSLLDIHFQNQQWSAAETIIAQLDEQFSGAVDASKWANARGKIEQWRSAQTAMQAELSKTNATTETNAKASISPAAKTPPARTSDATEEKPPPSGKAQIIADMEHAERIANTPALEAETTLTPPARTRETIRFDPNIEIEPADPKPTFSLSYDQQSDDTPVHYLTSRSDLNDRIAPDVRIQTAPPAIRPALQPRSPDDILADAEDATIEHHYKRAIRLYWQALGRANNRADIWNQLSRIYLIDGQAKNAETTALEATRLAPTEVDFTLDYLRVIQHTKNPSDFFAELETAYQRFPTNPEIVLSLARAYERIGRNNSAAAMLYKRFIELAPNHPLSPEAVAALARLH